MFNNDKTIYRAFLTILLALYSIQMFFIYEDFAKYEKQIDELQKQICEQQETIEELSVEEEPVAMIQQPVSRYASINLTDEDIAYAAFCAYHEDRAGGFDGMRAVIEVIYNRVLSDEWPNTVKEVILQDGQFACASYLLTADIKEPWMLAIAFDAVHYVHSYDDYILEPDVGYFKATPYTSCSYQKIGNHYFAKM